MAQPLKSGVNWLRTHPLRRHGVRLQALEPPGYSASLLAPGALAGLGSRGYRRLDQLEADRLEPYVLGGLCTGAMLLAAAAQRPRTGLRGFALLSPLFAYADGWALPWWYALRPLACGTAPRACRRTASASLGLRNERMRQLIRAQIVRPATSPARPRLGAAARGARERTAVGARAHAAARARASGPGATRARGRDLPARQRAQGDRAVPTTC